MMMMMNQSSNQEYGCRGLCTPTVLRHFVQEKDDLHDDVRSFVVDLDDLDEVLDAVHLDLLVLAHRHQVGTLLYNNTQQIKHDAEPSNDFIQVHIN